MSILEPLLLSNGEREYGKLPSEEREMEDVFEKTSDHDLDQLTAMFKLLSDKTRLNILVLLAAGERNVGDLCDDLKLPQPTVSHHLGLLRMSKVILNRRAGKQVYYGLNCKIEPDNTILQISVQNYDFRISRRGS